MNNYIPCLFKMASSKRQEEEREKEEEEGEDEEDHIPTALGSTTAMARREEGKENRNKLSQKEKIFYIMHQWLNTEVL